MLRFCIFLLLNLTATLSLAQATFKKRFGTSGNDRALYVEVLPDNSFIVAGGTTGGGLGSEDAMLTKFSATGDVEWSKVYGGVNFESFNRILSCSDGNYLALGQTSSMGEGAWDLYLVKFDGSGNVIWEYTSGGNNLDVPRGLGEVSDGYIVTGSTASYGMGNYDILVIKIDFDGNTVWSKTFGNNAADVGGEPLTMSNGQIWVVGTLSVGSHFDAALIHLDADGAQIGASRVGSGSPQNENMYSLVAGGPGMVGSGNSLFNSQLRPWLVGLNPSGGVEWAKRYVMPAGIYDILVEDCPGGNLVFVMTKQGPEDPDAYLVSTDNSGNILWAKAYSFGSIGRMHHVRPAPDGGYVAVGYCIGAGQDFYILKTDADGNVEGCCPMDAPITVEVVTPPVTSVSFPAPIGSMTIPQTADNQAIDLDENNLCNGSDCCPTDAGTMLEQTLHVCINQPATFTHNDDEVLENNDLLQFILFSDPNDTLGSIIAVSNTPTFTFNPATMQTGVTYYVAAIAGDNLGENVDLNDPCLDISNAAELIWHPLPEVELQADNSDVCAGGCQTITAIFIGTPPFTLTVSSPAGTTSFTLQNNTDTFEICPPPGTPLGTFTVQATALMDAYCACP